MLVWPGLIAKRPYFSGASESSYKFLSELYKAKKPKCMRCWILHAVALLLFNTLRVTITIITKVAIRQSLNWDEII